MSVKLFHYFSITAEVVSFITALLWSIRSENALLKVPPFACYFREGITVQHNSDV